MRTLPASDLFNLANVLILFIEPRGDGTVLISNSVMRCSTLFVACNATLLIKQRIRYRRVIFVDNAEEALRRLVNCECAAGALVCAATIPDRMTATGKIAA